MQEVQAQVYAREGRQQDKKPKDRNADQGDRGLVLGDVVDQVDGRDTDHQHRVRAREPVVFFPGAADVADAWVNETWARVAEVPFDEAIDYFGEGHGEDQVEGVGVVDEPGGARGEEENDFFLEEVVDKEGEGREGTGEAGLAVVGEVAGDLLEADDKGWVLLEI